MKRETLGRFTLLGTLYFAQGLPFGFFVQARPVLRRDAGYSLGAIGLSSLLTLPWALKFVGVIVWLFPKQPFPPTSSQA